MPATTSERRLRADAERNRRRVLDAAAVLFADKGLDVSMEEIAGAAGVGIGTLYRRFPDREALVDALFEDKTGRIADLATEALAIEDPWAAFEHFFRKMAAMQAVDQGLREALLSSSRGRERVAEARERIRPVVERLVTRAQAAGGLRPDISAFDVPMMQMCVGHLADRTRAVAPDYYERVVAVLLDGLRAPAAELPGAPLTEAQFQDSLARKRRC